MDLAVVGEVVAVDVDQLARAFLGQVGHVQAAEVFGESAVSMDGGVAGPPVGDLQQGPFRGGNAVAF